MGDAGPSAPFRPFEGHVLVGSGPWDPAGRGTRQKGAAERLEAHTGGDSAHHRGARLPPSPGGVRAGFRPRRYGCLLPYTGFVDWRDERMLRTADAVQKDLDQEGMLLRYTAGNDGLEGNEGAFCCCAFWLAECLASQGRVERAQSVFDRALRAGNDLGIFSEEYDPHSGEMLGNFPQALTHLSLISAAVALEKSDRGNSESGRR
jgi:hypothetical protein